MVASKIKRNKTNKKILLVSVFIIFFVYLAIRSVFYFNKAVTTSSVPEMKKDLSTIHKVESDGVAEGYNTTWTPFELDIPTGWTLIRQEEDMPAVLEKDDYRLTILYPLEGFICNFSDGEQSEGYGENMEVESEFNTEFGRVRIGKTVNRPELGFNSQSFRVCQKQTGSDFWVGTLSVGFITYQTPLNPNPQVISEMNTIVKSIKIKNLN